MRRLKRASSVLGLFAIGLIFVVSPSTASPSPHAGTLSIKIVGSHFVNGSGATVRLIGVGGLGTEYACVQGWGDTSTPLNSQTVSALKSWHANVTRLTLNEDCWLGINGQPSYGSVLGYRNAIKNFIAELNQSGIYAIIDLHWSAPGSARATDQMSMPDLHSIAFWSSVATTFKTNHAVLFDAFNEPFSPSQIWSGAPTVSWTCWRLGGCLVPTINQSQSWSPTTPTFKAVGMQQLVNAIRGTGATQPVLLGGLSYANDLSKFVSNEPIDSVHPSQLIASFHNYQGESCQSVSCWNSTIAPITQRLPVVTGEFGEGNYCSYPPTLPTNKTTFDTTYMHWADTHGVSYLAWGWVVNGTPPPCNSGENEHANYGLISSLAGVPVAPDGQLLKSHLAVLHSSNPLL